MEGGWGRGRWEEEEEGTGGSAQTASERMADNDEPLRSATILRRP